MLGWSTETDAINQSVDHVIAEDSKDRRLWTEQQRLIEQAIKEKVEIKDVFGQAD